MTQVAKHTKRGIDKNGHLYVRMVNNDQIHSHDGKTPVISLKNTSERKKGTGGEPQWFDEYKKYNLNKYPVGIDKDKVTINLTGDIDSHSVMKWKDPRTGKQIDAYTPEFIRRNAEVKWQRLAAVDSKIVNQIKAKADVGLNSDNDRLKQTSAIIKIIAYTGLRIGSREGYAKTKNRGVCTLHPDNVIISGEEIHFNFVGKSYKDNVSHIRDANLAKFLTELKKRNKKENFLFDNDRKAVDNTFKTTFKFPKLKLKDMRTYIATSVAKDVLYEDTDFPSKLTNNEKTNKKLIESKLKNCYDIVSKRLNNTPAMAKNSYIHPIVVKNWLIEMGANVSDFMKSFDNEKLKLNNPSLDSIIKKYKPTQNTVVIDDNDEENCDFFELQPWEK